MKREEDMIKVFVGVEASALLLKGILEEAGVVSLIKNDAGSAFLGILPQDVDLYIEKADLPQAEAIINDFIERTGK